MEISKINYCTKASSVGFNKFSSVYAVLHLYYVFIIPYGSKSFENLKKMKKMDERIVNK